MPLAPKLRAQTALYPYQAPPLGGCPCVLCCALCAAGLRKRSLQQGQNGLRLAPPYPSRPARLSALSLHVKGPAAAPPQVPSLWPHCFTHSAQQQLLPQLLAAPLV